MASVFSCSTSPALRLCEIQISKNRSNGVHFVNSFGRSTVGFLDCIGFRRCFERSLSMKNSLTINGAKWEQHVVSGVSLSNNLQRSKTFDGSLNEPDSTHDLERQLEEFFNEIKTMISEGKEDDAADLLQANYEALKEHVDSGARGLEEAAFLDVIALGYVALGDLRTVGSLMDVLHAVVNEITDEEPLLDSILLHMGSIYTKLENFEMSLHSYRRSLKIMERKCGIASSFLCTPLLGMAKVLGTSGRTSEAIETYKRVISLLESKKGREAEQLVWPLSALGDLLLKEGKAADAEYYFSRVLDMYMSSYGEKDGRVGTAMYSLAKAKCAKGDVNEAIDLSKNAIQILKDSKYMAADDDIMEKMRVDIAELLHVVGRGEEGRALLEECLRISEKLNGKEHPSLVPHLVNLATSYSRSKNFVESERLLRTSLHIIMKTAPPDDPSITFPMLHLAVTLYNLHQDEEAEKLTLEVLHIREKAFGKDSLPVGEALDCLVSIQSRLEKEDTELVDGLKRVLTIKENAFGPDSEEVVETLKKLIHYLDKTGMKNEKYPLQRRLSMLRDKHKQMAKF